MDKHYNPYDEMLGTLEEAGKKCGLSAEEYLVLKYPERELKVSMPIMMDNGTVQVFEGYRVQHSRAIGPGKGGVRFHEEVDMDEVKALAAWMSLKCALAGIPYGGAKGAVKVNPQSLSKGELERLTRKYTQAIAPIIGEQDDIPAPDMGSTPEMMGWMMDAYSTLHGRRINGVVTGKPVLLGGSIGRNESTGRGIVIITREIARQMGKELRGLNIILTGFGNVAGEAAMLFFEAGANVLGISDTSGALYSETGLDIPAIKAYCRGETRRPLSEMKDVTFLSNEELLTKKCDILIPSATQNQINEKVAETLQTSFLIEGANGPTTRAADKVLEKRGIQIVPDILANIGGVVVSYFEWVQNLSSYYWTLSEVNEKLERIMLTALQAVLETAKEEKATLRMAAYMVALRRLVSVIKARGFH